MSMRDIYLDDDDPRAWEMVAGGSAFLPTDLGKVSAWLRLAQATVTGSGYSSVPDVLTTNPAVQSTDARRPVNGTSANGLPIATLTDDFLSWPLAAGNNGATKWGCAFWMNSTADGSVRRIVCIRNSGGAGNASADKLEVAYQTGRGILFDAYVSNGNAWRARSNQVATGLHFWTVEYDGTQSGDANRAIITMDAAVIGGTTFELAAGVATEIPATLTTPTGNIFLGASTTVPGNPFTGIIGPNFWILNAQLSAAERAALMNFESPT